VHPPPAASLVGNPPPQTDEGPVQVCVLGNRQNLPLFWGCFSADMAAAFLEQAPEVRAAGRWGCCPTPARAGLRRGLQCPGPGSRRQRTLDPSCLPCPPAPCRPPPGPAPAAGSLPPAAFQPAGSAWVCHPENRQPGVPAPPDPAVSGHFKTLQALKLRWVCRMMDFSVFLPQLIEQGEFSWTPLSSPHLYSSKCLQSRRAGGAQDQRTSDGTDPREERNCPSFLLGLNVHSPACPSQSPCPGTLSVGALCAGNGTNRICPPISSSLRTLSLQSPRAQLRVGCSRHTQLPWGSVSSDSTGQVPCT